MTAQQQPCKSDAPSDAMADPSLHVYDLGTIPPSAKQSFAWFIRGNLILAHEFEGIPIPASAAHIPGPIATVSALSNTSVQQGREGPSAIPIKTTPPIPRRSACAQSDPQNSTCTQQQKTKSTLGGEAAAGPSGSGTTSHTAAFSNLKTPGSTNASQSTSSGTSTSTPTPKSARQDRRAQDDATDNEAHRRPGASTSTTAATATNTAVKTERGEDDTGKRLPLQKDSCQIRGMKNRYARWYFTKSHSTIKRPRDGLRCTHGTLYLHKVLRSGQSDIKMVWIWNEPQRMHRGEGCSRPFSLLDGFSSSFRSNEASEEGRWERIYPGHPHPDLEGYVLNVLDEGRLRWVKSSTEHKYRKDQRMRARIRGE